MHLPVPVQGAWIHQVVRGYFAYHAVPANSDCLNLFRSEIIRSWRLSDRWIPRARILHPWPDERFDARTRGKSPVR